MAYTLTYSRSTLSEGDSVIITLNTTGVPNGTLVPFAITGVGVSILDFTNISSLSGNFVIQNNTSSVRLNIANDLNTEGTESFILRLTGQGRTESIGITVLDTSQTQVSVAEFYLKPDKESVYEGGTVTFNVSAVNVPIGTVVPYIITGIQSADVFNVPLSGNLIFAANSTYDTTANVRLTLLEDNLNEGLENIVMLIYPTFAYSLQLSGTTQVIDTTTTSSASLLVSSDKQRVTEGGNVTFTVSATNVPAGTNVSYIITPWTSWDLPTELFPATSLSANDFIGLDFLYGDFPALSEPTANATTNTTVITFTTVDDYIFEQTEYFYLIVYTDTDLATGSGIVGIVDSGNTYLNSFSSFSGNAIVSFLETANLTAVVGGSTFTAGEWEDTYGLISTDMVIQGNPPYSAENSDIYYQPFSYVLRSSKSIEDWITSVKNVLHPAGFAIFSEINNETSPEKINYASVKSTDDCSIFTYYPLSIDSEKNALNVSNVNLTVDTEFLETIPQ
jgi:hypothetical protein